ncbi:hypothetical protein D6C84_05402 [Aureobasidium pullulans]|uniref:Uncharacterized protein n=1 Tax=Aureobasidium pullulans TaxID=5580 RepID=A0A4S9XUA3_AURPU|nr:hypothetical protein D6C84_05402 [Aureobasidium pullulans]
MIYLRSKFFSNSFLNRPENIGLEDFVEETIEAEAHLKAQVLIEEIPTGKDYAFGRFRKRIRTKVDATELVSDEEIRLLLHSKIKEQINLAVVEVAEEGHRERVASIQERLDETDEKDGEEDNEEGGEDENGEEGDNDNEEHLEKIDGEDNEDEDEDEVGEVRSFLTRGVQQIHS